MNANYCALFLLLSCGIVSAEEVKIAVLDTRRVMQDSLEGKAEIKKIEALEASETKKIEAEAKKIEALQKDVQAKLSTMSEAAIKKAQIDMETKQGELKVQIKTAENKINNEKQEIIGSLGKKAEASITTLAEAKKLDIVFDKSTGSVVYASGKAEITDEVMADMNKKYAVAQPKVGGAGLSLASASPAKAAPKKATA